MKKIIISLFLVILSVQSLAFAEQYDVWYKHPGPNNSITDNTDKEKHIYSSLCTPTDCIKKRFKAGTIFLIPTDVHFRFPKGRGKRGEQSNSGKTMYEKQKKGPDGCTPEQTYYDFLPLKVTRDYTAAFRENDKNIRYKYSLCATQKGIQTITKENFTIKRLKTHTIVNNPRGKPTRH